jgi:hypothetical protein
MRVITWHPLLLRPELKYRPVRDLLHSLLGTVNMRAWGESPAFTLRLCSWRDDGPLTNVEIGTIAALPHELQLHPPGDWSQIQAFLEPPPGLEPVP